MKFHAPSTILLYEMEDGSHRAKDKNRESCGQKLAHYTSDLRPPVHEMNFFFLFQIGYWALNPLRDADNPHQFDYLLWSSALKSDFKTH